MNTLINKNLLELNYNQETFKENYQGFLAPFTPGPVARGPVDLEKINCLVKELIEKAQRETTAVSFNLQEITTELVEGANGKKELTGGACSAVALRVAKASLEHLASNSQEESIIECLKATVSTITKTSTNRQTIRNTQAAFNSIFVKKDENVEDISQHKIKALAAYHDIKVISSTEELKVDETNQACQEKFEKTIESLESGVYLLRVLVKEDNHKLEKHGHSTVYIKLADGQALYFDTQLGLYKLAREDQKVHLIYQACYSAKKKFGIDSCKFHKLSLTGVAG